MKKNNCRKLPWERGCLTTKDTVFEKKKKKSVQDLKLNGVIVKRILFKDTSRLLNK